MISLQVTVGKVSRWNNHPTAFLSMRVSPHYASERGHLCFQISLVLIQALPSANHLGCTGWSLMCTHLCCAPWELKAEFVRGHLIWPRQTTLLYQNKFPSHPYREITMSLIKVCEFCAVVLVVEGEYGYYLDFSALSHKTNYNNQLHFYFISAF